MINSDILLLIIRIHPLFLQPHKENREMILRVVLFLLSPIWNMATKLLVYGNKTVLVIRLAKNVYKSVNHELKII